MWTLAIFGLLGLAEAKTIFNSVGVQCDPILPSHQGCLRGQRCTSNGKCVPTVRSNNELPLPRYHWDFDKSTVEHDPVLETRRPRKRPSQLAILDAEPKLPNPEKSPKLPSERGGTTTDGLCGSAHNYTVCDNWKYGQCCSAYGFCGSSISHCGGGCQSGPCDFTPVPGLAAGQVANAPGKFRIVGQSGVPAMTAILMQNGRVVFSDKIENYTQLRLSTGYYAYSSEYNPETNTVVPLSVKTNPFCAGGIFLEDSRLLLTGGNGPLSWMDPTVGDGYKGLRFLSRDSADPSLNGMGWDEPGTQISTARWYPSVQIMADGEIFIASGSLNALDPSKPENNNPTWEMLDKEANPYGQSITMSILESNQPYYMYPFLHLLKDGNLFVFVAKSSELFSVSQGMSLRRYPDLKGAFRTYPNTGSSALLPLSSATNWEPEVIVCGGGAYQDITSPGDDSCGRIKPLDENPQWERELMPVQRVMVETINLPDGTLLWINGCKYGAQGFGIAKDPVFDAWIYNPIAEIPNRWSIAGTSTIPRLYHSVALLLLDGTVMVAGSNPVEQPLLQTNPDDPARAYPTEFRVEIYTPPYLMDGKAELRPLNVQVSSHTLAANGEKFQISFQTIAENSREVKVVLYYGGVVTHALHMGQRMMYLDNTGFQPGLPCNQTLSVTMPPTTTISPAGPYVLYIVVDGIPSIGQFVQVRRAR